MNGSGGQDEALIAAARAARERAHAPYSAFSVGAALRLVDGAIITGSNFENASYGLSLCAETVAVAAANAQGRLRDIVAIAIAGGPKNGAGEAIITPCGRCRQVIKEAQDMGGRAIVILCAAPDGSAVRAFSLDQLLPHAFGPADLGLA